MSGRGVRFAGSRGSINFGHLGTCQTNDGSLTSSTSALNASQRVSTRLLLRFFGVLYYLVLSVLPFCRLAGKLTSPRSATMNDYESQRLENLAHKQKLLAELNLNAPLVSSKTVKRDPESKAATKKRKIALESVPTRASARIASTGARPTYAEDAGEKYHFAERKTQGRKTAADAGKSRNAVAMQDGERVVKRRKHSTIPSKDAEELRSGWTRWTPTGTAPSRDDDGTFHFEDHPTFTPNKSPEEVMREGCFGGSYWRPLHSQKLGIVVEDDWRELPEAWYEGLEVATYMSSRRYDTETNKFKVACGQSIEEWEAAGWIAFEYDIRGWFQWYCRFFQGRRCADDERQVGRWRRCVGEQGRWRKALLKKYVALGVREVFDDGREEEGVEVSPVMHQTCHHWAFEVRQGVLDEVWRQPR